MYSKGFADEATGLVKLGSGDHNAQLEPYQQ